MRKAATGKSITVASIVGWKYFDTSSPMPGLEGLCDYLSPMYDNNPNNHGIRYCGFDVHPPSWLLDQNRESLYIVVCTVNYASVISELDEMRFVMGEEFCCNPLLNERKPKDDLKSLARKVLVHPASCPIVGIGCIRGADLTRGGC